MSRSSNNNLWLLLEALARRRASIVLFVAAVTLLAVVVALLLPKWYRASSLLLPPKDLSAPIPGIGRLSELVSITGGVDLPVMVTSSDVYARILQSRTIAERLNSRFKLKDRFKADNFEETYETLMDRSEFRVTAEGLLEIAVEDRNPDTAAAMTNAFVEELDRVNRDIASERLRENRIFLEERLAQVKADLNSARKELETFQLKYRTVDFDEQTRLAIEQAIQLKVNLTELDIEIQMRERTLTRDNTELVELKSRRELVSRQLKQLEESNVDSSFFSLPVASIPALRGQYEVLYSRVRVGETLYRILLEQLEQAEIQENEKSPTISVLDRAQPPETASRPKRLLIIAASFGLSVIAAVFLAVLLEYLARLKQHSPEDFARVKLFADAFFGWLPGAKRSKENVNQKTGV